MELVVEWMGGLMGGWLDRWMSELLKKKVSINEYMEGFEERISEMQLNPLNTELNPICQ